MTTEEFKKEFEARRLKVEEAIAKYLPTADTRPSVIHSAMRYSMEAGGKRIRQCFCSLLTICSRRK